MLQSGKSNQEKHQLKSGGNNAATMPHPNGICCLNDGKPMMYLKFKGIELAACPKCFSLWLEQGKLEQLTAAIKAPRNFSVAANRLAAPDNKNILQSIGDAVDTFDLVDSIANIIEGISDL